MHPVRHLTPIALALVFLANVPIAQGQSMNALPKTPPRPGANAPLKSLPAGVATPRVLIAGDSWAQYMWDDGSHNLMFDRFGHGDKTAISQSLAADPGPGHTGTQYAISGSEAKHWVDTVNYPWIANMVSALTANPTIDTVLLSIGGNDVLGGKSEGGWYKDMDLDVPGSEAAFMAQLETDSWQIMNAALAVRPELNILVSSYDYPNFNVGLLWCWIYACDKQEDLSRDPINDLITDAELNGMMIFVETERLTWVNSNSRVEYDNAIGLMHHFYGDGISGPLLLPRPGSTPPTYLPFPGGNPLRPSLRSNFRLAPDPIHLDAEGYEYKIANQTENYFFPDFRGEVAETFVSQGGANDGWTDGLVLGTSGITVGDNGLNLAQGIVSFDTASLPDGATITGARFYLTRTGAAGTNPFAGTALGIPTLDVASGSFGGPGVELSDAGAPADFSNAGFLAGSASADGYAVGVEIDPSALSAINKTGLTQFRLRFPNPGAGTGADAVTFADGDDTSVPGGFPTLAAYMGTSQPFLDVSYEFQVGVGDETQTQKPSFLPASPNPFRSSTSIRFTLETAGVIRLRVFDTQGRLVAKLKNEHVAEGIHNVTWDGTNLSGQRVADGVYFAALETTQGRSRSRLVKVSTSGR